MFIYNALPRISADTLNRQDKNNDCVHYDAKMFRHIFKIIEKCGEVKQLFITSATLGQAR